MEKIYENLRKPVRVPRARAVHRFFLKQEYSMHDATHEGAGAKFRTAAANHAANHAVYLQLLLNLVLNLVVLEY
jgi:hypothetical protein